MTNLQPRYEDYRPWYPSLDSLAAAAAEGWSGHGQRDAITDDGVRLVVSMAWQVRELVGPGQSRVTEMMALRAESVRDGEDVLLSSVIEILYEDDAEEIAAKVETAAGQVRALRDARTPGVVRALRDAAEEVVRAEQELADCVSVRDQLVREAMAAQVPVGEVQAASGLSRARVYQIAPARAASG